MKGLYDPVCFFYHFSPFFLPSSREWGETLKKNFSYFYVMLMPVCCQIVVTLVLHQARRHARQLRDLEKKAMRGKARLAAGLSLSRIAPSCVDSFYSLLFWGRQRKHKQELGEELRASCVCAGRELVRLSCLFS